jgi:hypothetical protein
MRSIVRAAPRRRRTGLALGFVLGSFAGKAAPTQGQSDLRSIGRAAPRRRRTGLVLGFVLAACLAGTAAPTWARSEKTLAYPREQAWPTAVRFLAVDERVKITEKDAEAGYVTFELRDEGKLFRGSLEVVTLLLDGRSVVRFVLQIADRPSWLELAMLGRLERKLRAELGSPTPPPSAPPRKSDPGKDARPDPARPEPGKGKDKDKDKDKDSGIHDDGPPVSPTP